MTRRQLELAAKLYSYATMAHLDLGGADTDDDARVMKLAAKRALTKLRNLGVDRTEVVSIDDAITQAKRLRP